MFCCCNCDTDHPGDDWQPHECRCCKARRFYWAPGPTQIKRASEAIRDNWTRLQELHRRGLKTVPPVELLELRQAPSGRRVVRERSHV